MTLNDRLRALFGHRPDPRSRAAHDELVARLYQAEVAARALKVGEKVPDFLLPNAEGRLVSMDDLLAHGPVVLTFFRGAWCPYCDLTMRTLEEALPAMKAAGGSFAAIWPETGGLALATKRERGLTYELLVDVDNGVAMQFGVVFSVPQLYRKLLEEQGIDLPKRQGNPAWLLPIPATYIVARDRRIHYAFVEGDFTRRAEPADIIQVLRSLTTGQGRPRTTS